MSDADARVMDSTAIKLITNDNETENIEMGSQNHSILQARLAGLFWADDRYTVATELSLDVQDKDISSFFKESKNELKPDICLYPIDSDFDLIDTRERDDILKRAEMPCLVIEILSPTDKIAITVAKIRAYLKLGVKSGWLVFPDLKAIAIYSAGNDTPTFDMQHTDIVDKILDIHLPMPRIFATKPLRKPKFTN